MLRTLVVATTLLVGCSSQPEMCTGMIRPGLWQRDFQIVWGVPDHITQETGEQEIHANVSPWGATASNEAPHYEVWEYDNRQIKLWFLPHKDLVKWETPLTVRQLATPVAGDTGRCRPG